MVGVMLKGKSRDLLYSVQVPGGVPVAGAWRRRRALELHQGWDLSVGSSTHIFMAIWLDLWTFTFWLKISESDSQKGRLLLRGQQQPRQLQSRVR